MALSLDTLDDINNYANYAHDKIFKSSLYKVGQYDYLSELLDEQGIKCGTVESDTVDGYLRWSQEDNKPIIVANRQFHRASVHRRFVYAHEFAHLVVDYDWDVDNPKASRDKLKSLYRSNKEEFLDVVVFRNIIKSDDKALHELVVNEFASAFLIPKDKLQPIIDRAKGTNISDEDLITEIAYTFSTSLNTAKYRLKSYTNYVKAKQAKEYKENY